MESCSVPKCPEQRQENNKLLCSCYVFKSEKEMKKSLSRLCYGNMYVVGSIWTNGLQSALLGTQMSLVPTVEAAAKPDDKKEPPKPKPMKFTELPLDKAPHAEYKTYEYEKTYCEGYNTKLWHNFLLPYVSESRKYTQKLLEQYSTSFKKTCKDISDAANSAFASMLKTCRDDANLTSRRIAVGSAAALGFFFTSRKRFLWLRKLSGGAICATAVGALCFPEETDEAVRAVGYHTSKFVLACYNAYANTSYRMNEPLPCLSTMPKMPPPRPNPCGEARAKREAEKATLYGKAPAK